MTPKRMKQPRLDPQALQLPPERPLRGPRAVSVRQDPDSHAPRRRVPQPPRELPPGGVISQDVGFQQDFLRRVFDGLADRREGFLAAKEELNVVALMNRPCVNAANQPFKPGVMNAQRQRLGQRAHIFSAQFVR